MVYRVIRATGVIEMIDWHEPFAAFLELYLGPVGIEV